jgi:hypothetical protein
MTWKGRSVNSTALTLFTGQESGYELAESSAQGETKLSPGVTIPVESQLVGSFIFLLEIELNFLFSC